jgi:hypothetical protein
LTPTQAENKNVWQNVFTAETDDMDHNQGATAGDYAQSAASDNRRSVERLESRVAVLEREQMRLAKIVEQMARKVGR